MKITLVGADPALGALFQSSLDQSGAASGGRGMAAQGNMHAQGSMHALEVVQGSLIDWLAAFEAPGRTSLRAVTPDDADDVGGSAWPDVLVTAAPGLAAIDVTAIQRLMRRAPGLECFLLSEDLSAGALLDAMRAGVREVLRLPLDAAELGAALERVAARHAERVTPARHGRIYGITACKGGSGATFVAANLAWALAAECDKRVLLIDLDLQYGDASFYFMSAEQAPGSVASVMRNAAHLDAALLASSSVRLLPNLHVLHAPEEPGELAAVTPALTARLLEVAAQHYDCVLFDVNRSFDAVALAALDRADAIFAIMQSMVPDMRDARTMLRAFRELGYADSKLRFVVNRSDKKEDAPLRPIERGLGVEFYRTIPNDFFNASAAVNQGASIIKLAPDSPVSRRLCEIAADLTGAGAGQKTWLHKLLRRA